MERFIGKVRLMTEWVVELDAESFEDAEARLTETDWDITRDMEMQAPAEIVELFAMDGAEITTD